MQQTRLFTGYSQIVKAVLQGVQRRDDIAIGGYMAQFSRIEGGVLNVLQVQKAKIKYLFVSKDVDRLFGLRETNGTYETIRWRLRDVALDGSPPSRYQLFTSWSGADVTIKVRAVPGDDLFQALWWNDVSALEKYTGDMQNEN